MPSVDDLSDTTYSLEIAHPQMLIKRRLHRRLFNPHVHCDKVDITVADFVTHEGSYVRIIADVVRTN
jgi:hypothetical protein